MENTTIELNQLGLARSSVAAPRRERYARPVMTAGMLASDLLGLAVAGCLAIAARWVLLGPFQVDLLVWFGPVAALMVILFTLRKLYPSIGLGVVEEFRSLTIGISLVFIIVSIALLVLQEGAAISRFVFIDFWMMSMVTIPALRRVTRHVMVKAGLWGEPVAIIGPVEEARKLAVIFMRDPKIGLLPKVIFVRKKDVSDETDGIALLPMEKLQEVCRQQHLRTAVVLYTEMYEVEAICDRFRENFEKIAMIDLRGNHLFLNKVTISHYGELISLEVHHRLLDPWAQAFKRAVDICLAGSALALLAPFYVIVAGLIYTDSPGRILYRQRRLGKAGKEFVMLKLRTMHSNADELLESTLANDPALREEWDHYQKLKNDPRITRVGRVLRRFSLDELAQLWNVLKGEMSLVGPRPIIPFQRTIYGEGYQHYVRVAPGISGLWQINGRNELSFAHRTEMDMEYVVSWSIWLDIYIMVRTAWVVIKRRGAY